MIIVLNPDKDATPEQVARSIANHEIAIREHMRSVAKDAASEAARAAIDQLVARLGLEDPESLRAAMRFARSWEAAKVRFMQAAAAGITGALLLAIWTGITVLVSKGAAR